MKRILVSLPDEDYDVISELAKLRDCSMSLIVSEQVTPAMRSLKKDLTRWTVIRKEEKAVQRKRRRARGSKKKRVSA